MRCRLWVCVHSMTSGKSVNPVVHNTAVLFKNQQPNPIIAGPTRKEKIKGTQDTSFPNFWPLMRVQPMCAPRKARPLPRLWSDHGCVLFFSMRRPCDHWRKYYHGWSYIIYREFQKGENYVRMLVVREIRIHNGAICAMPTTDMERGHYQQQSGSSRWLLALESKLCRHSDYGHSASLSHASQRERKDEKKASEKKYSRL